MRTNISFAWKTRVSLVFLFDIQLRYISSCAYQNLNGTLKQWRRMRWRLYVLKLLAKVVTHYEIFTGPLWKWIYWHMFRDRLYADYSKCSPRISIYILRILNESLLHVGWFQICSLTYPAMFVMRHKLPPQCLRKLLDFKTL